ncbi:TIGR01777 family oxidoreductase [Actinokineospora pegani]|uniref:TIGR01777 family oxidoreductase n=1 Tax=Actinokineospora pegani TaxID=2654637 RepID=UPI0012EA06D6|nr:TIGR01777 family oxidoreductase [Actinokineospora pegani]
MLILVAGSSGLIGSALVYELRAAGHRVRRLVRRAPVAVDEFEWDPVAGTIAPDALDDVDAVVNLCGASFQGRWSEQGKLRSRGSRIVPARVLAEAVAARGIPTLVNASTLSYYGHTGTTAVDESAPRGGGFLADLAVDWEAALTPAREAGTRVTSLRIGLVLSRDGGLIHQMRPAIRLGMGGWLGDGGQYIAWISLPDTVAAIRFVVENESVRGPVNLCSPNPVTNKDFTKTLGRALSRPVLLSMPKSLVRLMLGEAADELALISLRVLPTKLTQAGFAFRYADYEDVLSAILADEPADEFTTPYTK